MQKANLGTFKKFNAKNFKVGIVAAQFNVDITAKLLASAKKMLAAYKVPTKNIVVHRVAGSIEIPVVLRALAETGEYNCLLAIGCVIRGDTPHFEYVCKMASDGILRVMMDYGVPVGFGMLTLENPEQAKVRFGVGGGAAEAALQAAKSIQEISQ